MSITELIKIRSILARTLSVEDVNDLGRTTGQAERLRTVTPHRLFLAIVSTLAGAKVESLADLLRALKDREASRVAEIRSGVVFKAEINDTLRMKGVV